VSKDKRPSYNTTSEQGPPDTFMSDEEFALKALYSCWCLCGQILSLTESPAHKLFAGSQAWEQAVSSKASQMRFR